MVDKVLGLSFGISVKFLPSDSYTFFQSVCFMYLLRLSFGILFGNERGQDPGDCVEFLSRGPD